jgi:quercetin dioxygenase-like cupin family protein
MPKIFPYELVSAEDVESGASKVKVRWLITKDVGAENFAMRLFEIGVEGYTPLHTHPWEHEIFVLNGKGFVFDGEKKMPFKSGDAVFVPGNEKHQFKNSGKELLKVLCLIPYVK